MSVNPILLELFSKWLTVRFVGRYITPQVVVFQEYSTVSVPADRSWQLK